MQDRSDFIVFQKEIEEWEKNKPENKSSGEYKFVKYEKGFNLQKFDANNISGEELKRIGIKPYVAVAWANYLKSGGKFYQIDDIKKIYGMDSILFEQIKPFACITLKEKPVLSVSSEKKVFSIDINKATKTDFEKLNGIGPTLAERIINYRNILGGYSEIPQLKEIFGLNDTTYEAIKNNLSVDTSLIKKINLNTADQFSLAKHPYITKYYAKAITNFRKVNGGITNVKQLLSNKIIPDSVYLKVKPYCL